MKRVKPKTFKIYTFGCRLNQAESQALESKFVSQGLKPEPIDKADLVVVNSCAVTAKAEKEARQLLKRIRRENPQSEIWLAGCMAERMNKKPQDLSFDKLVNNLEKRKWFSGDIIFENKQVRGFVPIQTGCDNFCSYCIVPYLRGRSVSRPLPEVIEHINRLIQNNIDWIVLTGVEVVQYNDQGKGFVDLIEEIMRQTKVKMIGFGSISPLIGQSGDSEKLVELFQKYSGRLACHLHLSLQSGSDKVLNLMRRRYSSKEYLRLVKYFRNNIENINITTDIIVGFPGETDKDFNKSIEIAQEAKFGRIHVFRYSNRPGTLADKMKSQWKEVDEKVKKERAKKLAAIEKELRHSFEKSQIGNCVSFLSVDESKKFPGFLRGQTSNFIPALINKNAVVVGKLTRFKLEKIEKGRVWAGKTT
jgi:threonylcarbamoyladenosine tRNA methylthiotransferase MtaB